MLTVYQVLPSALQPCEEGTKTTPILEKKNDMSEVKHHAPGPTVHKRQSQDLKLGSLVPASVLEPYTPLYLHCPIKSLSLS